MASLMADGFSVVVLLDAAAFSSEVVLCVAQLVLEEMRFGDGQHLHGTQQRQRQRR